MKILLVGKTSYIANAFSKKSRQKHEIHFLKDKYQNVSIGDLEGTDVVINFAAIVHRKGVPEQMYYEINRDLAIKLATLSKTANVKQFIQLSSMSVYQSDSIYGKSKLEADENISMLQDDTFCVSIVRPTVVYGKNAPGNVKLLTKLIKSNLPLPLNYNQNQRAIIYIDNLINLLNLIVEKRECGLFLAKDHEHVSLKRLSFAIKKELNSKSFLYFPYIISKFKFSFFDKLYGDLIVDDSKTVDAVGRYATISFDEAIKKTIS
jgi:UDP-glucose 4-epimerase